MGRSGAPPWTPGESTCPLLGTVTLPQAVLAEPGQTIALDCPSWTCRDYLVSITLLAQVARITAFLSCSQAQINSQSPQSLWNVPEPMQRSDQVGWDCRHPHSLTYIPHSL